MILFDHCYIANIKKWNNRESRVTGQAAKVAKVVINPESRERTKVEVIPELKFSVIKPIHSRIQVSVKAKLIGIVGVSVKLSKSRVIKRLWTFGDRFRLQLA